MKRHAGQAGRIAGALLHRLGSLLLLALTLVLLALCLLALRLAQGPVEIPYLASRLATVASGQGITVHMRHAELAWAGFHEGGEVPLFLALGGIDIGNANGVTLVNIPAARLVFAPDALLGGGSPILVTARGATFNGSNVPVSLNAALRLDFGFSLARADLAVRLGAGRLGAGGQSEPISDGAFRLVITPGSAALTEGRLSLAPTAGSAPHVTFAGTASRDTVWTGTLHVAADAVGIAALPSYWPAQASAVTRGWVVRNITAGTISRAAFVFSGTAPRTLSGIAVTAASGGYDGTGLTMGWLPGATPITGLDGSFTLIDIDHARIAATAGHLGRITFDSGQMLIAGLDAANQTGDLTLPLSGRIEDAVAVLNAPPLSLLKAAPPGVVATSGAFTGTIAAMFPFVSHLTVAQVDLHADLALSDVTVPVPVPGLAFTRGVASLQATMQGMALDGDADFGGGPCHAVLHAAFNAVNVLRDATLSCTAGAALLHRLGLDVPNIAFDAPRGAISYQARLSSGPGDAQTASLDADFTQAALGAPHFGWAKAAGVPGHLRVTGAMNHDALTGLSSVSASAPGLDVQAMAAPGLFTVSTFQIGATQLSGRIAMPAGGAPWLVDVSGPRLALILSPATKPGAPAAAPPKPKVKTPPAPPSGPLWRVRLAVAQASLAAAPAPGFGALSLTAAGQGAAMETAQLQAGGVGATLAQPTPVREALNLTAPDAGVLLEALGASRRVEGGDLTLTAAWDRGGPIKGTLDVEDFSILNAPAFAKFMQAMTLYGVGEAASGPGLKFSTLDAPFTLDDDTLTLDDARAYSASLGFTANGTVGVAGGGLHLNATIIPAYALNSLPGKIPVVGQLFTAETGGGLFAVNAHVTGPLDDPDVQVNPLSVLTPGIIRKVFGIGF